MLYQVKDGDTPYVPFHAVVHRGICVRLFWYALLKPGGVGKESVAKCWSRKVGKSFDAPSFSHIYHIEWG